MQSINVVRNKLISILERNKTIHAKEAYTARLGYQKKLIRELSKALKQAKAGKYPVNIPYLPLPECHTEDYDRVIGMLNMEQEAIIKLSEQDYAQYVLDNWDWSNSFKGGSNAMYLAEARSIKVRRK